MTTDGKSFKDSVEEVAKVFTKFGLAAKEMSKSFESLPDSLKNLSTYFEKVVVEGEVVRDDTNKHSDDYVERSYERTARLAYKASMDRIIRLVEDGQKLDGENIPQLEIINILKPYFPFIYKGSVENEVNKTRCEICLAVPNRLLKFETGSGKTVQTCASEYCGGLLVEEEIWKVITFDLCNLTDKGILGFRLAGADLETKKSYDVVKSAKSYAAKVEGVPKIVTNIIGFYDGKGYLSSKQRDVLIKFIKEAKDMIYRHSY